MVRGYWLAVALTLPLAANWVVKGFGWYVFYLTDPGFQWLWGTGVQVFGGIPLWVAAWRGERRFLWAAAPALALYLYSLSAYLGLLPAAGLPLMFDLASAVLVGGGGLAQFLERRSQRGGVSKQN